MVCVLPHSKGQWTQLFLLPICFCWSLAERHWHLGTFSMVYHTINSFKSKGDDFEGGWNDSARPYGTFPARYSQVLLHSFLLFSCCLIRQFFWLWWIHWVCRPFWNSLLRQQITSVYTFSLVWPYSKNQWCINIPLKVIDPLTSLSCSPSRYIDPILL